MKKDKSKEYLMMRQEILQYIEEYQSVRHMMYFVTATAIGLKEVLQMPAYIFLLPLVIIIPSYIIAIDYWKCVVRAATYLMVFHEKELDGQFRWETRHYMLGDPKDTQSFNVQLIPYYACATLCFILYFVNIDRTNYLMVGIGIAFLSIYILCILLFRCIGCVSAEKFIKEWKDVKRKEKKISPVKQIV